MQASDHLHSFQAKLARIRRLLARQITLSVDGRLPKTELEAVYELAFLNVFVAFENDLYELFLTNMLLPNGGDGKKRSLFVPGSRALAAKLLLGTNRYFQLLPVEQMEKTARVFLKNGGPFVCLTGSQKDAVGKAYTVRNHIAHRSSESKAAFVKRVLPHATLPKVSTSPGYYLRSNLSATVTYFDHHVSEIGGALKHISERS